jgi:hypothetical protein
MARSQSQIGIICETLLTASSDATRSLEALDTDGLIKGNLAYVVDVNAIYRLDPDSTTTPDNDTVIAATGGGNWLLDSGGDDPVVVRTIDDLPDAVAGVITLAAATMYLIEGEITIPTGTRIVAEAGAGISGGAGALLIGDVNGNALVTGTTGEALRINNIAITNNGSGAAVSWTGDGQGDQLWMHDVSLLGEPCADVNGGGDGDSGDYIYLYDCRFISQSGSYGLEVSGAWASVCVIGCRFFPSGGGILINSTVADELDQIQINGCQFKITGTNIGVEQSTAAVVTEGRIIGNAFFGGSPNAKGTNVVGAAWEGSGNVGLADF